MEEEEEILQDSDIIKTVPKRPQVLNQKPKSLAIKPKSELKNKVEMEWEASSSSEDEVETPKISKYVNNIILSFSCKTKDSTCKVE